MASTAQAVRKLLSGFFAERGFSKLTVNYGVTVYANENVEPKQYVGFDRMRDGQIRLWLSNDMRPGIAPPQVTGNRPIEGESPWFPADNDSLDEAIADAGEFLQNVGFRWLANPYAESPSEWRTSHNLLTRDYRDVSVVLAPVPDPLTPKHIAAIRKAFPPLETQSLLQLRQLLTGQEEVHLDTIPLADALPLQNTASSNGVNLELRNCTVRQ